MGAATGVAPRASSEAADCRELDLAGGRVGCLLLHGFSGTPFEMRFLGERLHDRGHSVRSVRLPGHATDGPEMLRAGWRDWYAAAADGFDRLRDRCDAVFAVGLSMGALLALRLADQRSEQVAGVVALAPAVALTDPRPARYAGLARWLLPLLPSSWKVIGKERSDILDPEARDRHPLFPIPLHGLIEVIELQRLTLRSLPRVRCPLLVVHGRRDATCPVDNVEVIRRAVGSTDVRTCILEDSAHIVTVDVERDRVADEIARFVAEVSAAAVGGGAGETAKRIAG